MKNTNSLCKTAAMIRGKETESQMELIKDRQPKKQPKL